MQPNSFDPPPIASPVGEKKAGPSSSPPTPSVAPLPFLRRLRMYAFGLPLVLIMNPLTKVWAFTPLVAGIAIVVVCGVVAWKMQAFLQRSGGVLRGEDGMRAARRLVSLNMGVSFATSVCLTPIFLCAWLNHMALWPLIIVSFAAWPVFAKIESRFRAQHIESASPEEQRFLERLWTRTLLQWKEPRPGLSKEEF